MPSLSSNVSLFIVGFFFWDTVVCVLGVEVCEVIRFYDINSRGLTPVENN